MLRRQRRERIAGIVLAVVGVVVLVVAIIALRDPKNPSSPQADGTRTVTTSPSTQPASSGSRSSGPTSSASSSASSTASALSDAQLKARFPLVVLNNTTVQGLASEAAQRFESGGWKITRVGNLVNNIISTCAYYDPSVHHAKAAAQALQRQFPTIKRVQPRFDGLDDGPVVVVLTPDYSSD